MPCGSHEGMSVVSEQQYDDLRAKLQQAQEKARYCTQCRNEGVDEVPLGREVYICFWCGDGFCHEHAAKHFDNSEAMAQDARQNLDAAIERGRLLCQEYLAQVGFGRVLAATRLKRAEAAEALVVTAERQTTAAQRDAAEQRALAEEWGKKLDKHHYPLKRDDPKCWVCYHFTPAEAQEEGDGA